MKEVLEKSLWEKDVQYVVLGSGEWQYESFFRELHDKYPDKLAFALALFPSLQEDFMQAAICS
jgi:starch synthase